MAAKKRDDGLSAQEKVKAALLPEEEQPHLIPENWVWTRIGKVADIGMGQSPAGMYTNTDSNGLPLVGGPTDMGDVYPTTQRFTSRPTRICEEDDIIISVRATIGKLNIADRPYCLGRGVAAIRAVTVNQHFTKWFLETCTHALVERGTGTTFLQISREDIATLPLPLPPLPEQQRIADKLELLLGKIKEAKRLLDEIPEILRNFRQWVLAAACSGRLTDDWRRENPQEIRASDYLRQKIDGFRSIPDDSIPSTWCKSALSFFADSMANGIYKPEQYYGGTGIASLRMYNIQNGDIIWKDIKRMNLTKEEQSKYSLQRNDLLINRVNSRELVGKSAFIEGFDEPVVFESKNIRLRLNEYISPKYVNYLFMTAIVRNVFEKVAKQTVGMATISQPQIAALVLPLPPIAEQHEIVQRVESLFAKANELENHYDEAMALMKSLPEVILSKAFHGKIEVQNPDDESAMKLLERIVMGKPAPEILKIEAEEAIMVKDEIPIIRKRMTILDTIRDVADWISAPDLLIRAGYPPDADPDTMEDFYFQLKDALKASPPKIKRERRGDNDYFRAL